MYKKTLFSEESTRRQNVIKIEMSHHQASPQLFTREKQISWRNQVNEIGSNVGLQLHLWKVL